MTSTRTCPCLYMSIGPSGAGKSTFAKSWAAQDSRIKVVSTDAKRKELFGAEEIQLDGSMVFYTCAADAAEWLRKGYDVIFDATNTVSYSRNSTLRWIKQKAECEFTTAALLFMPDEEVAKYRNSLRERNVPDDVIHRQYKQLWRDAAMIPVEFPEVYMIETGGNKDGAVMAADTP